MTGEKKTTPYSVSIRHYVEPCCCVEADPSMRPRTSAEIARLRDIYEE